MTRYIEYADSTQLRERVRKINAGGMAELRRLRGRAAGESIDQRYRRGKLVGWSAAPVTTRIVAAVGDSGTGGLIPVDDEVAAVFHGVDDTEGGAVDLQTGARTEAQLSQRWRDYLATERTAASTATPEGDRER